MALTKALTYAAPDDRDLANLDATPDVLEQRIRAASTLVRRTTRTAYYDTTPTGAPRDEDVAEGFRQAVIAQVVAWDLLGVDTAAGPAAVTGAKQSQSLLGGSVTYALRAGADEDRVASLTELVPAAEAILWDLTQLPDAVFVWRA